MRRGFSRKKFNRLGAEGQEIDYKNLDLLKAEIEHCFVDGVPQKEHLILNYPDYFPSSTTRR